MKITIAKKLLAGFLFVLLSLVIVSVLSSNGINTTQRSYEKLMDENMNNMMLAQKLDSHYKKQESAMRGFLLSGNRDYLLQFEKNLQQAKLTLFFMKESYMNEEDLEVIQQLEAFQTRYEELVRKGIAFKIAGNDDGYSNLMITSSKTISNVFHVQIETLVAGQEQLVKEGSQEVVISVERTKKGILFLSIFSIVLGAVLAIIISRSISYPLHQLAKYTEAIMHTGKVSSELPKIKSSTYEVKQLYESFVLAMQELGTHINQLYIAVQTDALTKLANRGTFDLVINNNISNQTPFSLIFIDIDFFKKVNDRFGHLVGDDVLRYLADTIKALSREGDLSFRYGGEEFAIIVPFCDYDTAVNIAERLRMKLESTNCPTGEAITVSLGISFYPEHGETAQEIIAAADKALYASKSNGRNQTTVYSIGKE